MGYSMRSLLENYRLRSFTCIFYILILINSIPILVFPYFHTLDGPSHLYNVNLLREIMIERNGFISQFFSVKQEFIPNWSSHMIMLLFRLIFPGSIANKLFLMLISLGLPLSIFRVIKRISPQNQLLAVFSLPFVYTFLFGLGFYNYCLGLVIYFMTLATWIDIREKISLMRIIGLFLLVAAGYFTHIFIFVLMLISLITYSLSIAFTAYLNKSLNVRKTVLEISILILVAIPLLILLSRYLGSRAGSTSSVVRLPWKELIKWILDARPLIIYSYTGELKFTRVLFFLGSGLLLYNLIKYFRKPGINGLVRLLSQGGTPFLFLSFLFILLYFVYPDSHRSGGSYISIRILIFAYLTGFIWLCTLEYTKLIKISVFAILLVVNFGLLYRYQGVQSRLNSITKKFTAGVEQIDENSVVLPIRNSDDWLDLHCPNYLGADKPLIILENYEATTNYFPIEWNTDELPSVRIGDSLVTDVCLYNKFPAGSDTIVPIDYIISWGSNEPDACQKGLAVLMEGNYELVCSTEDPSIRLFRMKEQVYRGIIGSW